MKRPRLRLPRVTGRKDAALDLGMIGGFALAVAAIALVYLPAGLFVTGVIVAAVCAWLDLTGSGE